ncbi:N-acetylmuramoyl-L-alanine amidase [Anaeromicrobium sediminis]|uniref:LysM domain-containing protein n=1 Tax=Anaeromicrobium sediminis TaxID=1478221 RepID=A0A267MCC5_9FIRM|nr:N-acetylmuramoyl-L-alanine amidase [Anaeromicrobium sediminis]PAB57032.1 hypothetical protein CCE28_19830 [Anaeromicrobium sediminis]
MNFIEHDLNFKNKLKKLNKPSMIVIHHAAHASANVLDVHRWHKQNGWSGIGYHFYIGKDGQIHKGRPENSIGAHCKDYNKVSLGICLQGNFQLEEVNKIQLDALIGLCQCLCDKYSISTIKGHGELKSTSCPGLNFPLMKVRQRVLRMFDNYIVKAGDTLWSIARHYNLTVLRLMELNGLKDSLIYPNQILKII